MFLVPGGWQDRSRKPKRLHSLRKWKPPVIRLRNPNPTARHFFTQQDFDQNAMNERNQQPLMTKRQLADWLQISTRTIDRYRSQGYDLGAVKMPGGIVRFNPAVAGASIKSGQWRRRKPNISGTVNSERSQLGAP